MSKKQAFQAFQSELHISYSQIFTYLACSLKYQFQYVEQRPMSVSASPSCSVPRSIPLSSGITGA